MLSRLSPEELALLEFRLRDGLLAGEMLRERVLERERLRRDLDRKSFGRGTLKVMKKLKYITQPL